MPRHASAITNQHRGAAPAFIIALLLATVATPVAADPIPLPPHGLGGEVEDGVVSLHWNGTGDAYNVYRNGALLATTAETQYTDSATQVEVEILTYTVTALRNGTESPPSAPWSTGLLDDLMPPDCELIVTSSNLSQPPFIFWNVGHSCVRAWEAYIEYLLGLCDDPPGCTDED